MSFEDSLQTRLTVGQSDPPETDLDYYAKPENYAGSNIFAMQRVAMAQAMQKQSESRDGDRPNREAHDQAVERLMERYKDVGTFRPQSTSGSGSVGEPAAAQEQRASTSHLLRPPVTFSRPSSPPSSAPKDMKKRKTSLSDHHASNNTDMSDCGCSTPLKGERPVRKLTRTPSEAKFTSDSDSDISASRKVSMVSRMSYRPTTRGSSAITDDEKGLRMLRVSDHAVFASECKDFGVLKL